MLLDNIISLVKSKFCKKSIITIRPFSKDDAENIKKWFCQLELSDLTFVVPGPGYRRFSTARNDSFNEFIKSLLDTKQRLTYAIDIDNKHIGNVGLRNFNKLDKSASLFIEIGEKLKRGSGVGTVVLAKLLEQAFGPKGLDKVCLDVLEFNAPAIHTYSHFGFDFTGYAGWHYDINHRYWRIVDMVLKKEKWLKNRSKYLPLIKNVKLVDHQ